MPKATDDHTTPAEPTGDRGRTNAQQQPETAASSDRWALGEMEPVIGEIESFIRMIGHLTNSPNEVGQDEWHTVESRLLSLHRELDRLWNAAFEEWSAEAKAHEAELAAAKARRAPASQAEAKRVAWLWRLLAATAGVALEAAKEAMPEGPAIAAQVDAGQGAESGRA